MDQMLTELSIEKDFLIAAGIQTPAEVPPATLASPCLIPIVSSQSSLSAAPQEDYFHKSFERVLRKWKPELSKHARASFQARMRTRSAHARCTAKMLQHARTHSQHHDLDHNKVIDAEESKKFFAHYIKLYMAYQRRHAHRRVCVMRVHEDTGLHEWVALSLHRFAKTIGMGNTAHAALRAVSHYEYTQQHAASTRRVHAAACSKHTRHRRNSANRAKLEMARFKKESHETDERADKEVLEQNENRIQVLT